MIMPRIWHELHERARGCEDPIENVYWRAADEIERLMCDATWSVGTIADLPLSSPRPWGLYCSSEGLRITAGHSIEEGPGRYHHVITGPRSDKGDYRHFGRRWEANAELIVRAVNNWEPSRG